jgi:RNA polymerase sigma-70 factor (ECF subfamily)
MKGSDRSSDRDGGSSSASSTSATLLEQVKQGDAAGWQRLMGLYRPLVLWWCRHKVARREDAEDVAQEVFTTVLSKVGEFARQRRGSFRAWLKQITHFKLLEHRKEECHQPAAAGGSEAREALDQCPDQPLEPSAEEDPSERRILLRSALELVRADFTPSTWEAAMRTAVEGQAAADVAAELGLSTSAVYIAKSRVLGRLRKELANLLE